MGKKASSSVSKSGVSSVELQKKKSEVCLDVFFGRFNSYAHWSGAEAMPMGNYLVYGPMGCGKYTTAMNLIRPHSDSSLRMCKMLNVLFNKKTYYVQMSDVHFEVDMHMMGSSARLLWVHLFQIICDIVVLRKRRTAYVLCKNFNAITNDLLDIFQTYVSPSNRMNNKCNICFILLTDCISFVPNNILSIFTLLRVPIYTRDNGVALGWEVGENLKNSVAMGVDNLAELKAANAFDPHRYKRVILANVEEMIYNYCSENSLAMRNALYDVYIYNWNIYELIWRIFSRLMVKYDDVLEGSARGRFHGRLISQCFYLNDSFEMYNVNYRPILHIERMMISFVELIRSLNDLKASD